MTRVTVRELIFAANTFAAAVIALLISFWAGLDRPFWAMATAYIASQPLSGAARSKAVFRLVGTVVGAGVTVVLIPTLSNAPVLLSLTLALWVAGCQFVSLLDRTPRSYMFMLAGYTAALVGFPCVGRPEAIFDTAVLRAEEIGIGVLCAAFIHSVVFPRSVSALLGTRLGAIISEAQAWIADALSLAPPARTAGERRRLAADVTELHAMVVHLPFDTARIRPRRAVLSAVQDRLVMLLPLVSAVEDRLRSLVRLGPIAPDLAALMADIRDWVRDPVGDGGTLLARAEGMAASVPGRDWRALLTLNLAERLGELVQRWEATRILARQVAEPDRVIPGPVQALVRERSGRPLHRDYGMALLSAFATFVAITGCCAFWIATAWPEGAVAAMIAAVICCFFATLDDPVPAQRSYLLWTVFSTLLAGLYLFVILPAVHGLVMLVLALAPTMLVLGVLMARPHWYGRTMPVVIGFVGGLALTNEFAVDAATFLNSNIAQLVGCAAAILATQLVRSMGAAAAIRRLRRAGWRDLAALAGAGPRGVAEWTSRMLDRVGLLAARIGEVQGEDSDAAAASLRELRIGINVAQLDEAARPLRSAIADHFAEQAEGAEGPPSPVLLDRIDQAIAAGWGLPDPADQRRTLAALTGLRRNFFPDAPAWQAERMAA